MIEIIIYKLQGCMLCEELEASLQRHLSRRDEKLSDISLRSVVFGDQTEHYISVVSPRVFPTVIVFSAKKACLGWEGFANLVSPPLQDLLVLSALNEVYEMAAKGA
jgi:hypothetical protein